VPHQAQFAEALGWAAALWAASMDETVPSKKCKGPQEAQGQAVRPGAQLAHETSPDSVNPASP